MIEGALREFAHAVSLSIDAVAVLVVGWGSLEAALALVVRVAGRRATHGERKAVWRRMGMWLLLGLEFELAADIVRTVISPEWLDIGQLGAIAVIRTFLNYFLEKDLESAKETGAPVAAMPRTSS
jgi:uncharacterized membrane protein